MATMGNDPSQPKPGGHSDELWIPVHSLDEKTSMEQRVTPFVNSPPQSNESNTAGTDFWRDEIGVSSRLKLTVDGRLSHTFQWFKRQIDDERDMGAQLIWAPVWFGIGCAAYFALPREPLSFAFPGLLAFLLILFWFCRKISVLQAGIGVSILLVAGVSMAQFRTNQISTTMLSDTLISSITGLVERVEVRANGRTRYTIQLLQPLTSSRNAASVSPVRVRLTARKSDTLIRIGDVIEGRARLGPPPGPAFPGAYDFSFYTWFDGIGASGFFLGEPAKSTNLPGKQKLTLDTRVRLAVTKLRFEIASIIRQTSPNASAGVAIALIVGDRSSIEEEATEALRKSGLAHILAISGLHMALVAATVMYGMRALMACFSAIALQYPIRKWASCAALLAATAYLFLSGASISTQRAYIMVAIMLLAVLLDRKALTMRNVALAALLVLFLSPQAVLSPGFQMSFAAVAALVATFEVTMKIRRTRNIQYKNGVLAGMRRFLLRDVMGLATTAIVAGIATGLFAAYHFYRIAPLGLLANLLAMPIVSILVMPLALISTLLMPFGLESYGLTLLAHTTGWVVSIAKWVAGLTAAGVTGFVPVATLLWGTIALLFICLMRTRLKLMSIPFLVLCAFSMSQRQLPDVLILENGRQIGVFNQSSNLHLLRPNAEKFSTQIWRNALGINAVDARRYKRGQVGKGFRCDEFGCSIRIKEITVSAINNTSKLYDDCVSADVLVIPYNVPNACSFLSQAERPLIIDRSVLQKYGSHSISIRDLKSGQLNTASDQIKNQDPTRFLRNQKQLTINRAYAENIRLWTHHRSQNNQ